jgi:hypothetical protein
VEQDCLATFHREQNTRDPVSEFHADFPKIRLELSNQRHSDRPSELHGPNLIADHFPLGRRETLEPFYDRTASIRARGAPVPRLLKSA